MSADRSSHQPSTIPVQIQKGTQHWAFSIATFFGAGYLKPGPGTWGSLAAALLWFVYASLAHPTPHLLLLVLTVAVAIALIFGIPAATIAERQSGRTDPGFVVIDEVIGQWITLFFSPPDWRHGLIALLLFRLFDIAKPFPVRRFERLPGGWGIIFDDVAAGLYALGVVSLLRLWI